MNIEKILSWKTFRIKIFHQTDLINFNMKLRGGLFDLRDFTWLILLN